MNTSILLQSVTEHANFQSLQQYLNKSTTPIYIDGLLGSFGAVFFATLFQENKQNKSFLFVLNDAEEAGYFYNDLTKILNEEKVFLFPSLFKKAVKFAQIDEVCSIMRTDVLSKVTLQKAPVCIVTYPEALSKKVVSLDTLQTDSITLSLSQEIPPKELAQKLQLLGFKVVDYVYNPGEYARRGYIFDIYAFGQEYPVRIDYFDDEIESLRYFDTQTQLSVKNIEQITLLPEMDKKETTLFPFTDVLTSNFVCVFKDYNFINERIATIYKEGFVKQALATYEAEEGIESVQLLEASKVLMTLEEFQKSIQNCPQILLHSSSLTKSPFCYFKTMGQPLFHKNINLLSEKMQGLLEQGYKLYVCSDSEKQTERLRQIFEDQQLNLPFTALQGALHEGFIEPFLKIALFTDHQIFDRFHKYNLHHTHSRNAKVSLSLKELQLFEIGDYIVHIDHGIGKFAGLIRIPIGNSYQEVIKILFQKGDAVLVSIHALYKLSKYKAKDGDPPRLSALGTGTWEKIKEKTKKKIKDIARDLILLYAQRMKEKGFSFSPDSFLQHELEANFKYEDTPDQLKVTQEVKKDMESERPMDRLICGDVGFGKTEIAIRAAFKAVSDNKQVAILVPTTVLAFQHYHTFVKRLEKFPVKIAYLSRARKPKDVKEILNALASGEIDIIVGTHKLIGKQVKFFDLGLLIIDEEHKFGVSVKEKLKQLRVNIDTLTMSATPIPRTLQFSLMGARDFSIIATPPPNRHPIETQVILFEPTIIQEVIEFELSRGGQVFVVSNRIATLSHLQALIQKRIPQARIAVAHGQMAPQEMEEILTNFMQQTYDILISTTIIENGIDIPNANTIIIDAAHHFGLSDLHQMRGRVGRSNRKAFCYLIAPPLSALPTDTRRRLEAIENYSDLGSGIHIALQDLDIRGAGNLLGEEQSGFIADLGYETYQKILKEALKELKEEIKISEVKELRDNTSWEVDDCIIECEWKAYFPESYVPGSSERMLLYRELYNLNRIEDITTFKQQLLDRFGNLPEEAQDLLTLVEIKLMAKEFGVEKMMLKGNTLTLNLVSNIQSIYYESTAFGKLLKYVSENPQNCVFLHTQIPPKIRFINLKTIKDIKTIFKTINEYHP